MYLLNSFKESVQSHPILILAFVVYGWWESYFLLQEFIFKDNRERKRQYQLIKDETNQPTNTTIEETLVLNGLFMTISNSN
jgi:hypothetical protein